MFPTRRTNNATSRKTYSRDSNTRDTVTLSTLPTSLPLALPVTVAWMRPCVVEATLL